MTDFEPLISVVITTKNEERNIETCIKSILEQSYPQDKIEIIVVDNNSTDQTKELAQKYTNKVFNKGPERSAQRNYGLLEKSSGEYLLYLDADMILSPQVLAGCMQTVLQDPSIVALYISEIVLGKKYFSRVRRFERSFYDGTVIDGSRFFVKSALKQVGGFDETMSGPEDWDLDKKLKQVGKVSVLDKNKQACHVNMWSLAAFVKKRGVDPKNFGCVLFHNESEFRLKKYLSKKGYYAKSFATYQNKWGASDPDLIKQLGIRYRFVDVFVENGKWKKLIAHPHLALGMYALRLMVGLSFLRNKA
ncbi:glycosyltransferase [Patescibacteria group bacterium]|nr:glycosyltransferase [Patescibacteria group bacterium]